MLQIVIFFCTLFFLAGAFSLTALINAFRSMQRSDLKKTLRTLGNFFFYRPVHLFFFPERDYEGIFFSSICAQNIARFGFAAFATIFLSQTDTAKEAFSPSIESAFAWFWLILSALTLIFISFIVGDYLPRIFGTRVPNIAMQSCAPFSSIFLFLAFPITWFFLKVSQSLSKVVYLDHSHEPATQVKQEIIDLIQETRIDSRLSKHDKKLIESVLTFREHIAREVMVPRINVFSLSAQTTIREAADLLQGESYSRIPIYKNTVDNIVGVLMYKDILNKFREYEKKGNESKILEMPIESIQKNVLYTPETKKLSSLLQEFRKKQVHLAIVVDEYGGTEGIVTIEDILEEIVGEISDEYDQEEAIFRRLSNGSWIVDARMNILDVEEQLEIKIPQEGDYDTLNGFVFHCAGTIPSKGFVIHQDGFDLEILNSTERSVQKVRLTPRQLKTEEEETTSETHSSDH